MASLARAIAVLGTVSVIGTATQVAKGKIGAVMFGAAGIGVLNQLTTLYSLLFIIAGLGFFNGMIRHFAIAVKEEDDSLARAQVNSMILFLGGVSLVVTLACFFASEWISDLLFGDGGKRAALVSLVILAVPIAVQQRIFRAYLSATRDLKGISRAQASADIASVAFFAAGAWFFDLRGAVAAFIAMHALLLLGMAYFAIKGGGSGIALAHPRNFRWSEVKANFGFGVIGVMISATSAGTAIIVARMIISFYDLAQAGIFSVAFKVATVYLGALYAAAGSYYFPTLVRIDETDELQDEVNRAVALYMTILPPIIIGLIALGDIVIPLLFSSEFIPAVIVMSGLLLGDIFRVTSETMGLSLLARKKLVPYSLLYVLYAAGFIALSYWLLPIYGLIGVAYAYVGMRLFDLITIATACRATLGIRLTWYALRPFLLAIVAVLVLVVAEFLQAGLLWKLALAIGTGLVWLLLSWTSPEFARLRTSAFRKLAELRTTKS